MGEICIQESMNIYVDLGVRHTWGINSSSFSVTLSGLLNFFEPQFLDLKDDNNAGFHVRIRGAYELPNRSSTW